MSLPEATGSEHHHLRPGMDGPVRHDITPESAGWRFLGMQLVALAAGEEWSTTLPDREAVLVPLSGAAQVAAGDDVTAELSRASVFDAMTTVAYGPPGTAFRVEVDGAASEPFVFALGSAPAEGRYPARFVEPSEVRTELRGGGAAHRQISHTLAHPLPAERLIVYEVHVPRGSWSGWPPHCHDGYEGSPYLEETYYFRLDPGDGWAIHRNYRVDTDFDETFAVGDGDVVLVTQGFHSSAAAPGNHMYFLNFLAGELEDDERGTPPFFQPEYRWIDDDWDADDWSLPRVTP